MIEVDFKCQELWKLFFRGKILATCTLLASYKCSLFPCKSTRFSFPQVFGYRAFGEIVQSFRASIWSLINRFLPMQNSAIGEVSCCIHIHFQQLHKIITSVLRRLNCQNQVYTLWEFTPPSKNEHRPFKQMHRSPSHRNHHTLLHELYSWLEQTC